MKNIRKGYTQVLEPYRKSSQKLQMKIKRSKKNILNSLHQLNPIIYKPKSGTNQVGMHIVGNPWLVALTLPPRSASNPGFLTTCAEWCFKSSVHCKTIKIYRN